MENNYKSPFSSVKKQSNLSHYDNNSILNQNNNISTLDQKYIKYNTSSDFIRTSYSFFPKTTNLKKQIVIPFSLNISPLSNLSDNPVPIFDYSESYELPRCKNPKCRAYLNPYVDLIQGNEQWRCNICKNTNEVFDYYNIEEKILDKENNEPNKNSELNTGTYEYISYKELLLKENANMLSHNYFILIDISHNAINSGFTPCVLESIKDCINNNNFYGYDNLLIKMCIITYDQQIHFYPININTENEQNNISMLSINENINNLFIPTNKDFLLVDLKKYKDKFIQIIENIQNLISSENYKTTKEANRFFDVLKISDLMGEKIGGKILIFSGSNLAKLEYMNNSNNKEGSNISQKYKTTDGGKIGKLGINLSIHNLGVNVFQCCNSYTNIRTLNQLIINSNGNLFFYRNFSSELHYKNIFNQIHKTLQNQVIFECGLKLRFSHNISIKEYVTPVLLYNKDIIFFPNLDQEQSISFILEMNYNKEEEKIEDYIINDEYTYIQASFFYKRGDGKKIIRIFNLSFPVTNNPKDIYDSINTEFLGSLYAQKIIMNVNRNKNLIDTLKNTEKELFLMYKYYFNNLNMIKKELSEEMKIYTLYILGLFKNCLFNKNDRGINNDDDLTNFYCSKIQKFKIDEILCFIYPRIYPLNDILNQENTDSFPSMINNNKESLLNNGNIFLIDNGFYLLLYITNNIDKKIVNDLFEVNDINQIDLNKIDEGNVFDYNENKNETKNKIAEIIDNIRNTKSLYQDLKIIIEGINDQKGKIINEVLIEDNYNREYPYTYEKLLNKIIFE